MIVALITGSVLTITNIQISDMSFKPGRIVITVGAHPRTKIDKYLDHVDASYELN